MKFWHDIWLTLMFVLLAVAGIAIAIIILLLKEVG